MTSLDWNTLFGAELAELRTDAAERDRRGGSDRPVVQHLKDRGVTAVRVPPEHGGRGADVRELFELVIALATADSAIAHALRAHFVFGEGAVHAAAHGDDRWIKEVAAGRTMGSAVSEQTNLRPMDLQVRMRRDGDDYLLSGVKHYTTGSVYADWIQVIARDDEGQLLRARIPTDRAGIEVLDDFTGMGQKGSASGSIRFDDVRIDADEVSASDDLDPRSTRYRKVFAQLYLAAVLAGIARAAQDDATAYVLERARVPAHGHTDHPRDDLLVQRRIGQIAANAAGARAAVLTAATALDAASAGIGLGDADLADLAVQVAQAHTLAARLAIEAGDLIFTVGSGSAVSGRLGLDRHWRNARTVAAHSPMDYKHQVIGAYLLSGQNPPDNGYF